MHGERGNILFLILLAVVLFAALSYAVTQSMRGGGNDASKESAEAKAAELMNYFTAMDTAVQRMMMVGNVRDYELNFYYNQDNNFIIGSNDNTNCTASRCRVFDPNGGNVPGMKMDPRFTRHQLNNPERIFFIKVPGVGTNAMDIVYLFHNADINLCRAINKKIGVSDILYNIAYTHSNDGYSIPYLTATIPGPITDNGGTIPVTEAVGQRGTFCFCEYANEAACNNSDTNGGVYSRSLSTSS